MEQFLSDIHLAQVISTVIYSVIGLVMFIISFIVLDKLTPYSIHKEIEEDQNIALGIIIGSVMIALAIIISAAIR